MEKDYCKDWAYRSGDVVEVIYEKHPMCGERGIVTGRCTDEVFIVTFYPWKDAPSSLPIPAKNLTSAITPVVPDVAEALQELISFLIHDGLNGNSRLIPIINRGTKALKKAGVDI